jgi:hypothetical protein
VIATLPTGEGGTAELWKLNHYYERLDNWYKAQGVAPNPFLPAAAEPQWELHNLTADPEERHNQVDDDAESVSAMKSVLESQRDAPRSCGRAHHSRRIPLYDHDLRGQSDG